jgi:hypothetical protein
MAHNIARKFQLRLTLQIAGSFDSRSQLRSVTCMSTTLPAKATTRVWGLVETLGGGLKDEIYGCNNPPCCCATTHLDANNFPSHFSPLATHCAMRGGRRKSDEIIARTWQQLDRRQPQGDLCAAFSLAVASQFPTDESIKETKGKQDSLLTFHP